MITVIYNRKHHSITIDGHANAAAKGEDLICSAVTILARTIAADARRFELSKVATAKVKLEEGKAYIKVSPPFSMKNIVTVVLDSLCTGFQLLTTEYPEYVSYIVK